MYESLQVTYLIIYSSMRRKSHDYRGGRLHVEPKKKKFNTGIVYEVISWTFGVIAAIFLAVFIVYSVGIKTSVIGDSMEPTLVSGQEIYYDRVIYQFSSPKRGDVIVFHPNGNQNTHLYVKRIVALPGETVQIMQGKLYVNGKQADDDYGDGSLMDAGIAENQIVLGSDDFFVLGDNRVESEDSRSADIGTVSRDIIEGKAWLMMEKDDIPTGRIQ